MKNVYQIKLPLDLVIEHYIVGHDVSWMVISLITTNAYDYVELGYEMPMSEMSFLKLNFPHGKLY